MAEIISILRPQDREIVLMEGQFKPCEDYLETKGYNIASAEEIAKARVMQGKNWEGKLADISLYSGWVREGVLVLPQTEQVFLTRKFPSDFISPDYANCEDSRLFLTDKQVKKSLEDSILVQDTTAPTKEFQKNDVTRYLLGNFSEEYGNLIYHSKGIKELSLYDFISIGKLNEINDSRAFIEPFYFKGIDSSRNEWIGQSPLVFGTSKIPFKHKKDIDSLDEVTTRRDIRERR